MKAFLGALYSNASASTPELIAPLMCPKEDCPPWRKMKTEENYLIRLTAPLPPPAARRGEGGRGRGGGRMELIRRSRSFWSKCQPDPHRYKDPEAVLRARSHTYRHTHTHTHTFTHTYIDTHTHIHTLIHTHPHTHTHCPPSLQTEEKPRLTKTAPVRSHIVDLNICWGGGGGGEKMCACACLYSNALYV